MRRALALLAGLVAVSAHAQEPVRLYAAGSLRGALNEVIAHFKEGKVEAVYGPSGLLRSRIEKGEPADVFASANMQHPQSLAKAGKAGPVRMFARNRLCALAAPGLAVTTETLLERLLDPAVKVGTSTPKADPSGDYAFELFAKAERLRPGLTYCTNALQAQKENPAQSIVRVPEALAVGADYGLTVMNGARAQAERFAAFVLAPQGQSILAKHGFAPGDGK